MDKTLTNKQQYIYEANNTCKHCKPLARLGVSESGMADAKKRCFFKQFHASKACETLYFFNENTNTTVRT